MQRRLSRILTALAALVFAAMCAAPAPALALALPDEAVGSGASVGDPLLAAPAIGPRGADPAPVADDDLGAMLGHVPGPTAEAEDVEPRWVWPGGVAQVITPFERPSHEYGPGHRGIDIAVSGEYLVAPDDGVIAFRGTVVDRPLITIDHGGGLVSTLEPVASELSAGDPVARGDVVGTLASGGNAPAGTLHLGARLDGEYIDPRGLLGALERPVLLPCC